MVTAVFVEGAADPPMRSGRTPLEELWESTYLPALVPGHYFVVPISKKTIVALDPDLPKMSGAAEAFDQLFMRVSNGRAFDRALVLWDMVPAWNPNADLCRREELLSFYKFMAASAVLAQPWKAYCFQRHQTLDTRTNNPGTKLVAGQIGVVIMAPMFEDLLIQDESIVRTALAINPGAQLPRGWPTTGWDGSSPRPDEKVLAPAISSARKANPQAPVFRAIRGDFRTSKNEWAEYILRKALNFSPMGVVGHPLSIRLSALL